MIMTDVLIQTAASERGLDIPDSLHSWLLTEYETEPFEGFFLEEDLKALVAMHYSAFMRGMLDPKPHDPARLWKSRYEGVCELLDEYRSLCRETEEAYEKAIALLDLHNIPH